MRKVAIINRVKRGYRKQKGRIKIGFLFLVMYLAGLGMGKLSQVVNAEIASVSQTNILEGQFQFTTESWGLGFGDDGTVPTGTTSADELQEYDAYYVGDGEEKVIYLTFDAGYENGNTEAILDALKAHDAPATFFVVGTYLETEPELIQRMVEEGHTVGNHTYNHPDMTGYTDIESFAEELESVEQLYTEITGEEMTKFYRAPQGKYSIENLAMAQELGYETFFWSLAYVDWYQDDQPTKEEAFDKLLTRIHPGAIVLLHSTSSTNAEIMDELLTEWEEMGYRFGGLEEF